MDVRLAKLINSYSSTGVPQCNTSVGELSGMPSWILLLYDWFGGSTLLPVRLSHLATQMIFNNRRDPNISYGQVYFEGQGRKMIVHHFGRQEGQAECVSINS